MRNWFKNRWNEMQKSHWKKSPLIFVCYLKIRLEILFGICDLMNNFDSYDKTIYVMKMTHYVKLIVTKKREVRL